MPVTGDSQLQKVKDMCGGPESCSCLTLVPEAPAVSGTHSPLSGGNGPGETKLLFITNWVMRPFELFVAPCGLGWPLLPLPRQDPSHRDPRPFCSAQIALICAWRIQVVS